MQHVSLRFFFKEILKKPFTTEQVPIKKKEKQLPKVISKNKIKYLIDSTKNLKHKIIIALLYSTGIRLNELINLKRADIDFDKNLVTIRKGKGKKERITIISKNLRLDLLKYYSNNTFNTDYIFEGRKGKYKKISAGSLEKGRQENKSKPYPSYAQAFFCYPFTGRRHRHKIHTSFAWAFRCKHHSNIH